MPLEASTGLPQQTDVETKGCCDYIDAFREKLQRFMNMQDNS
jgi:hypothetical protein